MQLTKVFLTIAFLFTLFDPGVYAQQPVAAAQVLDGKQRAIVRISAFAAKGNLTQLRKSLHTGLDAGLTVNQIKEVLVHLYAYCGFPRSIRGLQAFMQVLGERKAKGLADVEGVAASAIVNKAGKYERGRKVLEDLTQTPQKNPLAGYAAFAPVIDTFLKEHLFADLFERDVLTYAERELVTISVLGAIGGAEPMLKSHLAICLNLGLTPAQLQQFVTVIKATAGTNDAKAAQAVLEEVIKDKKQQQPSTENAKS